jgi:peptide/nickel transport system permease protein
MAQANPPIDAGVGTQAKSRAGSGTLARVAKYMTVRVVTLLLTVIVSIYLTILIANMGGYVDNIRKGEIREQVFNMVRNNPTYRAMTAEVRAERTAQLIAQEEHRLGLDKPFVVRSFAFLKDALTLNLGRAERMTSDSGSRQVRLIILERLPHTLVLIGSVQLLNFFLAVFVALALSRNYGSFLDKTMIAMSPFSAAPGWFYGLFLILIFAGLLRLLPFGGAIDAPPPTTTIGYIGSLLKHMILPVLAWTMSAIWGSVYAWRTFFLIYSSEDYVEMAKAKGLSAREIERRYILRPTLPNIITSFALLVITMWTGAPILETVFNWPGLGRTVYLAICQFDTHCSVTFVNSSATPRPSPGW